MVEEEEEEEERCISFRLPGMMTLSSHCNTVISVVQCSSAYCVKLDFVVATQRLWQAGSVYSPLAAATCSWQQQLVAGNIDCVSYMHGLPICRRLVGDVCDVWGCSDLQTDSKLKPHAEGALLTPTPLCIPSFMCYCQELDETELEDSRRRRKEASSRDDDEYAPFADFQLMCLLLLSGYASSVL